MKTNEDTPCLQQPDFSTEFDTSQSQTGKQTQTERMTHETPTPQVTTRSGRKVKPPQRYMFDN